LIVYEDASGNARSFQNFGTITVNTTVALAFRVAASTGTVGDVATVFGAKLEGKGYY
jgi:hypothetical protein